MQQTGSAPSNYSFVDGMNNNNMNMVHHHPSTLSQEQQNMIVQRAISQQIIQKQPQKQFVHQQHQLKKAVHRPTGEISKRSKYRGVSWSKQHKKWRAIVHVSAKNNNRGRSQHIGNFDKEIDAARAWDNQVFKLRGRRAQFNFPAELAARLPEEFFKDDHNSLNTTNNDDPSKKDSRVERSFPSGCSSRYRGVSWCRKRLKWRSVIHVSGQQEAVGTFDKEIDAAIAWDRRAYALRGLRAQLNFPLKQQEFEKEMEQESKSNSDDEEKQPHETFENFRSVKNFIMSKKIIAENKNQNKRKSVDYTESENHNYLKQIRRSVDNRCEDEDMPMAGKNFHITNTLPLPMNEQYQGLVLPIVPGSNPPVVDLDEYKRQQDDLVVNAATVLTQLFTTR